MVKGTERDPTARQEALTLAAYYDALSEFGAYAPSRRLLVEQLGDVDGQATHPVAAARLALAGRLIAAAQVAERVRLPEPQVHGIIRAWLTNRAAERDDAAPPVLPPGPPEHEQIRGLTRRLVDTESQGSFSRAAWGIAGMVLQRLIGPTVDVTRALAVRESLCALGEAAVEHTDGPRASDSPSCLLTAMVVRVRADGRVAASGAATRDNRRDAWLRIGGDTARAHARWSKTSLSGAIGEAVARASERLAGSRVPEQPERFDDEAAVEHAVQAAFDAAVTALGTATRPACPVVFRDKPDVLATLMEAASSGLVGAWVADHRAEATLPGSSN